MKQELGEAVVMTVFSGLMFSYGLYTLVNKEIHTISVVLTVMFFIIFVSSVHRWLEALKD